MAKDQSVSDIEWWFSDFAEFEDFVGIGEERAIALAEELDDRGYPQVAIRRMLTANKVPLEKVFVVPPDQQVRPDRVISLDDA
jgi:hypothetical protein